MSHFTVVGDLNKLNYDFGSNLSESLKYMNSFKDNGQIDETLAFHISKIWDHKEVKQN